MKTYLTKATAYAVVMTTFFNCSIEPVDETSSISEHFSIEAEALMSECDGSNPKSRVTNNGTVTFDYEIFDTSGSLISGVYNISPGTTSDWTYFSEGTIIFNLENGTDSDQKVAYQMLNCTEIDMVIDANNILTATEPQVSTN